MARLPKNVFEHYIFSPYALPVCNDFLDNTGCDSDCLLAHPPRRVRIFHPRVFAHSFPAGVVICCQNYVKYGDCSCRYTFVQDDHNLELFFHPPKHICQYLETQNSDNQKAINSTHPTLAIMPEAINLLVEPSDTQFTNCNIEFSSSQYFNKNNNNVNNTASSLRNVAIQVSPKFMVSRKLEIQNKATISVEVQTCDDESNNSFLSPQNSFDKTTMMMRNTLPIRPPGFPGPQANLSSFMTTCSPTVCVNTRKLWDSKQLVDGKATECSLSLNNSSNVLSNLLSSYQSPLHLSSYSLKAGRRNT